MSKKGLIFDLDGTLWDSSEQVVMAWNRVFGRYPELNKVITIKDMQSFMGKRIEEIAQILFPDVEEERRSKIIKECCNEEQIYLTEHGGVLYPDLEKTLAILSKQYFLYIVSNCQDGYVQAFLQYHKLQGYFKDIEMSGRTGRNKGQNIKLIIARNQLDKAVYIGDTRMDAEAAKEAGIPLIYAKYGFGSVLDAQYEISQISELPERVNSLL